MLYDDEIMQYIIESENRIAYAYYLSESDEASSPKEEGIISKGVNALVSAVQALIAKIKEMISSFTKHFTNGGFDSAEQKAAYEKFKKYVASNPELKNVKVSIRDFKEYEKVYDKYLGEIEKECNKDNPDKGKLDGLMAQMQKEVKAVTDVYKGAGGRAAGVVTLDRALAIADRNATAAELIRRALEDEESTLELFGKSLTEKELNKAKKKVAKYANNGLLHRFKLVILRRKQDTLWDVIGDTKKMATDFIKTGKDGKPKFDFKGALKHPVMSAKIILGKNAEGEREGYKAIKHTLGAKRQAKDLSHFLGVDKAVDKVKDKFSNKKSK